MPVIKQGNKKTAQYKTTFFPFVEPFRVPALRSLGVGWERSVNLIFLSIMQKKIPLLSGIYLFTYKILFLIFFASDIFTPFFHVFMAHSHKI